MKKIFMYIALSAAAAASVSAAETATGSLAQDSELVTEILPNGLTVAVYPNKEPPNRVSMRLVVKRGSLAETPEQCGLAHFTEHMAFKGTKNFPSGEMIEYFQRIGMAFGADTNAYTSFDETVYKIDMPDVSEKSVADGMKLLADYSSGVLFESAAIEPERGVIIAEKRSRETAPYRAFVAEWKQIWGNTAYSNRFPIGLDEVINSAQRDEFLKFYKSNYRPENIILVVVGDVSAAEILKCARSAFGGILPDPAYAPAPLPKIGLPEDKNFEPSLKALAENVSAEIFVDPELKNSSAEIFVLSNSLPEKNSPEELCMRARLSVLEYIFSRRFEKLSLQKDSKITKGDASFEPINDILSSAFVSVTSPAGDAKLALLSAAEELSRALKYGFTKAELREAKAELLNRARLNVSGKSTRKTQELGDSIAGLFARGRIVLSPETLLEAAEKAYENFDAKAAHELLLQKFSEGRVCAFIADTKAPDFHVGAVLKSVADSEISAPQEMADLTFAYSQTSSGAKIESKSAVESVGVSRMVFENKVRLNVKKTDYSADSVLVRIDIGAGKLDFPENQAYLALLADLCFEAGGLEAHTRDELESIFAGKTMSMNFSVQEASFVLSADTNKKDFKDQLLLLRAYITNFALRREALSLAEKKASELYKSAKTTPEGAMRANVMRSLLCGDKRFGFDIDKVFTHEDLRALGAILKDVFSKGWLEISVVGDIDEDSCEKIVGEVFGALPPRASTRENYDELLKVKFSAQKRISMPIKSQLPRAVALLAWRTSPMADISKARAESLLGEVLDDAMRKSVREKMGAVYSPFAYDNANKVYPFGVMIAGSLVETDKCPAVIDTIALCAKQLPDNITDDMFARAKIPLVKQIEKMRRDNRYWVSNVLALSQAYPERLNWAATIVSGFDAISLQDVKDAAKRVFSNNPVEIVIAPEK